jgi:hypothetical protein
MFYEIIATSKATKMEQIADVIPNDEFEAERMVIEWLLALGPAYSVDSRKAAGEMPQDFKSPLQDVRIG